MLHGDRQSSLMSLYQRTTLPMILLLYFVRSQRYIQDRQIFQLCTEGQQKRGTNSHLWWWEQQMSISIQRVMTNLRLLYLVMADVVLSGCRDGVETNIYIYF